MYSFPTLLLTAALLTTGPGPHRPAGPAAGITRITYETASGGRLGGYSRLAITPDSTVYVEGTRGTRKAARAKTAKATWEALTNSLSLSDLRKIKSSPGHQASDGTDVTLTITQGKETISCVNAEEDAAHYPRLQPFMKLLNVQLTHFAAKAE